MGAGGDKFFLPPCKAAVRLGSMSIAAQGGTEQIGVQLESALELAHHREANPSDGVGVHGPLSQMAISLLACVLKSSSGGYGRQG